MECETPQVSLSPKFTILPSSHSTLLFSAHLLPSHCFLLGSVDPPLMVNRIFEIPKCSLSLYLVYSSNEDRLSNAFWNSYRNLSFMSAFGSLLNCFLLDYNLLNVISLPMVSVLLGGEREERFIACLFSLPLFTVSCSSFPCNKPLAFMWMTLKPLYSRSYTQLSTVMMSSTTSHLATYYHCHRDWME